MPLKYILEDAMKFIFEVRMKDGHASEEYAEAWVRASEIIQQALVPGALNCTARLAIPIP